MTILFAMHVEKGHVCAGLRLAEHLRSRGHRVVYLGMQESEGLVRENGFEFVPFAEDVRRGPAAAARERELQFREFLECCVNGHLDERILRAGPDVIFCDSLVWYVALRGLFLKIPVVSFAIPTSGCPGANIPPAVQARIPGPSARDRFGVRADWRLLRWRYFFTKTIASKLLGHYRAPARMHHLMDVFRTMARQAGLPCREGETYRFTEFGPQLILPEIALLPKALEFPDARTRMRHHLGDTTAPARAEDTRLLARLDPAKPLVYCSLGSAPGMYPHAGRFFRAAVEASRLRPGWQFVVAVGGHPMKDLPRSREPNLVVTDWAPQLALLERASVMVTHGGIGSILECIRFGVPMVIVPGARDQPGNMARAVYHGIAIGAKMASVTAEGLAAKAAAAMASSGIRSALAAMRAKIEAESGLEEAAEFIEAQGLAARVRSCR